MASRGERCSPRLVATLLMLTEKQSARPRLLERRGREGPGGRIARGAVSTCGFPGQRLGELGRCQRTAPRPAQAAAPSRNGTPIGIGLASDPESEARSVSVFGRRSSRRRFQMTATCGFAAMKRGSTRCSAQNPYRSGSGFSGKGKTNTNREFVFSEGAKAIQIVGRRRFWGRRRTTARPSGHEAQGRRCRKSPPQPRPHSKKSVSGTLDRNSRVAAIFRPRSRR